MLYRVFPFLPDADVDERGGALYVPRQAQGRGRHDHPAHYGAIYVSRVPESAVAEQIQDLRGQVLTATNLRLVSGAQYALASLDDGALQGIVDLDDPAELTARALRPSMVATRNRTVTHDIALRIFSEGAPGFSWWSTLESSWPNVTLFAERVAERLSLAGIPEPLTLRHPAVRSAADAIGVRLTA